MAEAGVGNVGRNSAEFILIPQRVIAIPAPAIATMLAVANRNPTSNRKSIVLEVIIHIVLNVGELLLSRRHVGLKCIAV